MSTDNIVASSNRAAKRELRSILLFDAMSLYYSHSSGMSSFFTISAIIFLRMYSIFCCAKSKWPSFLLRHSMNWHVKTPQSQPFAC